MKILRLPGLEAGGDLVDYVQQHGPSSSIAENIEALADAADIWQAKAVAEPAGVPSDGTG